MSNRGRQIWLTFRNVRTQSILNSSTCPYRPFSSSAPVCAEAASTIQRPAAIDPEQLTPHNVITKEQERLLEAHKGLKPIGSRRARVLAQLYPDSLPFEQMPYQCFQEARKVLAADREEKLQQIAEMRAKIAKFQSIPAEALGGDYVKKGKVVRMEKFLEELKILADINDPLVKKRFEDGKGDMERPIYRFLADRKWREYKRPMLMRRVETFHLVPDIFPHLDPVVDVDISWSRHVFIPGEFVDSRVSDQPPRRMKIQPFDKGERLVSIVVYDPDVPDLANDSFTSRCHYIAVNIPISPTKTAVDLLQLDDSEHVVLPWLPAFAQKGAPYHRLPIFVFEQPKGEKIDVAPLREKFASRDGWRIQKFTQPLNLQAVGLNIFRTKWDEGADSVGQKAGIPGANVQFIRKKPEKLPYKKKDGARFR